MKHFAHTVSTLPETEWETMQSHETVTGNYCRDFLRRIDPALGPWGELLGRWHDLGKYQPEFQARLHGEAKQVEHAGIGAALAAGIANAGQVLAFAIAGHHTGLANLEGLGKRKSLRTRVLENTPALGALKAGLPRELLNIPTLAFPAWMPKFNKSAPAVRRTYAFFTRMLFSALVDADRLATDEFYARVEQRPSVAAQLKYDSLSVLGERLDNHIDILTASKTGINQTPVNALRADVLKACREKALLKPGIFSFTVPTGGGKTLAAMSFAVRHAIQNQLDRVIVAIPFTSIIEQNVACYRLAFGQGGQPDHHNVLEHHSGIDEQRNSEHNREAEIRRQLAAENWDAPIVVSTTVQFFESLFSDHPSRCRKLHRVAKSVILLDEVQTLPPELLLPILDGLRELATRYGSSIVLCTATPPALADKNLPQGLKIQPVIENALELAQRPAARRVQIEWRTERITPYAELALELSAHQQVLAVVHKRADARTLAELLPTDGRFHLSALMCPAHRLQCIAQVRAALAAGQTCRVISTQLIEAGVDIDLPVVYRALAGLDSLAQAAGRCDREGILTQRAGQPAGKFVVFRAETSPPPGTLSKAMAVTDKLLGLNSDHGAFPEPLDPFNPEHCELFFAELYRSLPLDGKNIQRERSGFQFENVAAAFQMIQNGWACPLVVPWGEGRARSLVFREQPSRITGRALQPYTVQVARPYFEHLLSIGVLELWQESLGLPTNLFDDKFYDQEFGLLVDPEVQLSPDVLIS